MGNVKAYEGDCRKADAIVVVSGGDTNARTDEAIKLYKEGWAPLIVVSGAAASIKLVRPTPRLCTSELINSGVPEKAIVMDESSETTRQNATEVKNCRFAKKLKM